MHDRATIMQIIAAIDDVELAVLLYSPDGPPTIPDVLVVDVAEDKGRDGLMDITADAVMAASEEHLILVSTADIKAHPESFDSMYYDVLCGDESRWLQTWRQIECLAPLAREFQVAQITQMISRRDY